MKKEGKTKERGTKERRGHNIIAHRRTATNHPTDEARKKERVGPVPVIPSFVLSLPDPSLLPLSFPLSFFLHRGGGAIAVRYCSLLLCSRLSFVPLSFVFHSVCVPLRVGGALFCSVPVYQYFLLPSVRIRGGHSSALLSFLLYLFPDLSRFRSSSGVVGLDPKM